MALTLGAGGAIGPLSVFRIVSDHFVAVGQLDTSVVLTAAVTMHAVLRRTRASLNAMEVCIAHPVRVKLASGLAHVFASFVCASLMRQWAPCLLLLSVSVPV
jgi:hypothetical protein